jgi:DNA-binding NarL/FixJ family response regulator
MKGFRIPPMKAHPNTRILIVDDSSVVREQLRKLLEMQQGWQVCGEAVDGEEAVAKTAELNPDLIILDFAMPGMNGLQSARKIAQSFPEIPIVLFTMFLSNQLIQDARNCGIRGAVAKTDVVRDLVPGIEAVLREETYFPEAVSS